MKHIFMTTAILCLASTATAQEVPEQETEDKVTIESFFMIAPTPPPLVGPPPYVGPLDAPVAQKAIDNALSNPDARVYALNDQHEYSEVEPGTELTEDERKNARVVTRPVVRDDSEGKFHPIVEGLPEGE